jgi:hypothetical protein
MEREHILKVLGQSGWKIDGRGAPLPFSGFTEHAAFSSEEIRYQASVKSKPSTCSSQHVAETSIC